MTVADVHADVIPPNARCGFCTMPLTPVSRAHQSIVAPGLYACSEVCAAILTNRTEDRQ